MAEVKVIEVQIKSNINNATTSISKLKSGLKEATTESKALGDTMQGSKQSDFINQLGDGIGKLNPAFGNAVKGANGLILKMWEMCANPVGAIVAALVIYLKFLYESFQSSVAGGKEIKAVMAALSGSVDAAKDAVFGLGRSLINVGIAAAKFISLDFKGASEAWKKAGDEAAASQEKLKNVVNGTTGSILYDLDKRQQANDKARKIQEVTDAEGRKKLVEARELVNAEGISTAKKLEAIKQIGEFEKQQATNRAKFSAEDLAIAKAKQVAYGVNSEQSKKMNQEVRDLQIAATNDETESTTQRVKLSRSLRSVQRQGAAEKKQEEAQAIADKKAAIAADLLALEESLKKEGLTFQQRRELIKNDKLIGAKERQKLNDQIDKEEKKTIDDHNKAIADLNKKYDDEKLNRLADTAVKKEELDYARRKKEIEDLTNDTIERNALIEKLDQEHKIKMATASKTDAEKAAADKKAIEDKAAADKIDKEKKINEAIATSKQNLNNIIAGLESSGLAKTKAGQVISKAIALTQIGIDSAVAISKASTLANAEGVAAQLAFPTVPGVGTIARVVSYASTAASVIGNIARAKQLLSSGSASSGGNSPSSGSVGASTLTPAAPQFNVVGTSATNQLAQSIGQKQNQPIKTYVVGSDITNQQSLDRNTITTATL